MSYVTPKKNTEYIFFVGLNSQADTKLLKANPTLAAGDFKVSIDGGTLNNFGTLPTVTPAAGKIVKITLSAGEMNGDNITLVCSDAAGSEWCDLLINIQTSVTQIDELVRSTTPANTLDVSATGEVGLDFANIKDATGAHTLTNITIPTVNALAAAGIDSIHDEVVEGALTFRQIIKLLLASNGGKSAGGGTGTITFRDNADSKNRISATVDSNGNRTAVTLDGA